MFPLSRNRRLRTNEAIRSLVRQTIITPNDFLVPLFVVEGKGIKGKRIATQAFGSSKPLVENLDEKSRSLNRRVEMKILEL